MADGQQFKKLGIMKKGIIYICHHIDTEGPMWESIEELFDRLENIFNFKMYGIELLPTYENLEKLQKGEIDIPEDMKHELYTVVNPHTVGFKRNWGMIEEMLNRIMRPEFRNQILDSFGGGWIYNWHIMDHVGFGPANPRHRDYGYHNVLDFYRYMIKVTDSKQDAIHWHFHPISFDTVCNHTGYNFENCMPVLHSIITRRLVDRGIFPVVNRPGFHSERIDANFFLEQWIPFDPANQVVDEENQPKYQSDMTNGRCGDWRGAPSDWSMYHPDFYDWRRPGNMNRWIARILNMMARHRCINEYEIEKAFAKAETGENVYLGITNHDWREMSEEINEFRGMLANVAAMHPDVKFKFSETVEAFRKVIGYTSEECEANRVKLVYKWEGNLLHVNVENGEPFGPQPYLAIKDVAGHYYHDNFDFNEFKKSYCYTFCVDTVEVKNINKIMIAVNDKYGNQEIIDVQIS